MTVVYLVVSYCLFCYSLAMKRPLYNSKIYFDSYDNEAFAPQEFGCYKPEKIVKLSDKIKGIKFEVLKGGTNVQLLQR